MYAIPTEAKEFVSDSINPLKPSKKDKIIEGIISFL